MERLQRLFGQAGGFAANNQGPATDQPTDDTSEQIHISSLALLKVFLR